MNELEIVDIIKSLKNSNSAGDDNISVNILKKCAHLISKPLMTIVNLSLVEGIFPERLKIAKIIPIFKSNCRAEIENYRPVSILSSFSKILEKCIATRLISFFEKHRLFNVNQFGFRKGRSTTSAIAKFLTTLYDNINIKNKCIGIFLDLSKAFDLVCHASLILKLERYGIRGQTLNWFRSYLCGRKHYTVIDQCKSNLLEMSVGIPQGSVLGPLLYIIYVNSFHVNNSVLFADDTSILVSATNTNLVVSRANQQLREAHTWFTENKLVLNSNKSIFMRFNTGNLNFDHSFLIKSNTSTIRQVKSTKFLGLHFAENLSWTVHINETCKKVAPICYCLNQLRDVTNQQVLLSYYYAHFNSIISYAIIAWGSSPEAVRVFKLQKKAVRFIVGVNRRTSCRNIFKQLGILPLPCLFLLNVLLYAKSELSNLNTLNYNHNYNTRNSTTLETPTHQLTLYEKSPKYMAIKVFNKLPNSYKVLSNKEFKNKIKSRLI